MRIFVPIVAVALCVTSAMFSEAKPLRVMSFNVRYDNPGDRASGNGWETRRDRVADAINFYSADIVGTQEVLHHQLEDLKTRLPEYEMTGVGREDGRKQGEYAALWWKRSRYDAVESGSFWLSETPDVAGSMGWDGACVRIATWAVLRDRETGQEVFALNTHLDHVGEVARREGVSLILKRVAELAGGRPTIVTGDFNSTPDSDVVAHVTGADVAGHLRDSRAEAGLVYGPAWSYHEYFKLPEEKRTLIDYVFVDGGVTVVSYGVLAERNGERCLSDHCPVLVNLDLAD